jgi:hypothetical protein
VEVRFADTYEDLSKLGDVVLGAGEKVVRAEDVVAFGQEALAQVGAEEACALLLRPVRQLGDALCHFMLGLPQQSDFGLGQRSGC